MDDQVFTEPEYRKAFFDSCPIGIGILHKTGRIVRANNAFSEFVGYSSSELKSKTMSSIIFPTDVAAFHAENRRLAKDSERDGLYMVSRILTKDGTTRWCEVFTSVIRFEDLPTSSVCFLVPLPNSGFKVEQGPSGVSIRPDLDWVQLITSNPKQSFLVLLVALFSMGLIPMESVEKFLTLFINHFK